MISKFSVKRPYTVFVGVILVVVLGIVSLSKMTADLLPPQGCLHNEDTFVPGGFLPAHDIQYSADGSPTALHSAENSRLQSAETRIPGSSRLPAPRHTTERQRSAARLRQPAVPE